MIKPFYDLVPYSEFPLLKQPFEGIVRCCPIFKGFFLHIVKRDGKYRFRYNKNDWETETSKFADGLWEWFSEKGCFIEEISLTLEHKVLDQHEIMNSTIDSLTRDQPLRWDDYRLNVYFITGYGKGIKNFRFQHYEPKNYWELDEYYSEMSATGLYNGIYVSMKQPDGFWKHYVYEFNWLLTFTISSFNRTQGINGGVTADGKMVRMITKKGSNWTLDLFGNSPKKEIIGKEITIVYQSSSEHPFFSNGDEYTILVLLNTRQATEEEIEHTRLKRAMKNFDTELRKGLLIYQGN